MRYFIHQRKLTGLAIVLAGFSLLIFQHLWAYTGHFGFDDLNYAELAHAFFQKQPIWDNTFTFRFGIVIPLGILYWLFGVSDGVSIIFPMLVSLGLLLLVYDNLKGETYKTWIATAILLSNPWITFYSDKIGVDIPITLVILLAITILYKSRFGLYWQKKLVLSGFLLASTVFLGLLTKETIWFLFPLVVFFFFIDLIKLQRIKFWLSALVTLSLFLAVYFYWQYLQFGNWFYRFELIQKYDNTNLCSYDRQPLAIVLNRIGYELFLHFVKEAAFILPVLAVFLCIAKQTFINIRTKENFWLLSAIILILTANFWSISYHSYHPLCVDIRHYLFIMPVSAIAIAHHYKRLFRFWPLIFLLAASMLVIIFDEYWEMKTIAVYQAICLILIFGLMLLYTKHQKYIFLGIALLPLLNVYVQLKSAKAFNYPEQRAVAQQFIKDKKNTTVYAAETQIRLFKYHLGFQLNHFRLVPYDNFEKLEDGYHYWNYHAAYAAGELDFVPPEVNHFSVPEHQLLDTRDMKIWRINKQFLDAELEFYEAKKSPLWTGFVADTVLIKAKDEFGPTFKTMINADVKSINISAKWKLKKNDLKGATVIFTLEEQGKMIFWKPFSIYSDRAVVDNWYVLYKSVRFENFKISKQAELKVYIWNNFKTELEIAEASVSLVRGHKD
ncbi:hypothetical protein FYC62_01215 [Pedobacter aquae]|uniref:Glycosyltransferase RgtA/B/C/D-like domain-containing protein n=1 Tax=Pedobacter aquae TaxID=2605747 RepID=A0A5C0VCE4_9SPHI|nr:hypothetical protein [Pedobacter aquae]QEK50438.1 hypothetical protein FYC62_01215 [Pedobacter aquae]